MTYRNPLLTDIAYKDTYVDESTTTKMSNDPTLIQYIDYPELVRLIQSKPGIDVELRLADYPLRSNGKDHNSSRIFSSKAGMFEIPPYTLRKL